MITTIVSFPLPPGLSIDTLKKDLVGVAPQFQAPPGLLRKYFLISEDGAASGGVYLWKTSEQARDFSEGFLRSMIRENFHVDPSITYFDTPVIVDNITSEILTEYSEPLLNAP